MTMCNLEEWHKTDCEMICGEIWNLRLGQRKFEVGDQII